MPSGRCSRLENQGHFLTAVKSLCLTHTLCKNCQGRIRARSQQPAGGEAHKQNMKTTVSGAQGDTASVQGGSVLLSQGFLVDENTNTV